MLMLPRVTHDEAVLGGILCLKGVLAAQSSNGVVPNRPAKLMWRIQAVGLSGKAP